MATKLSIPSLRKIRKELEERANRCRYDERFDSSKVELAIIKKFSKDWEAIKKLPIDHAAQISFCGNYGLQIHRYDSAKLSAPIKATLKKMKQAYDDAKTTFEEASQYSRLTKLAERVQSLEVDCLLNGLETDDPKVIALLEEVRAVLV